MHNTSPPPWGLLATQFLTLGSLILPDRPRRRRQPRPLRRMIGWVTIVTGAGLSTWAGLRLGPGLTPLPTPPPHAPLQTQGPYRFARHPIYLGLVIAGAGRWLTSRGPRHLISCLTLAWALNAKANLEESILHQTREYTRYSTRVPRWGVRLPK